MLVSDLITLITLESGDLLDDDMENIPYINHAIDVLSFFLDGIGDPEMITTADVQDNLDVPSNFVDFVPHNGYPVYILGGKFMTTTGGIVHGVKYTTTRAHVSKINDPLPFKDMYANVLVLIASYMIKKKTYIPVEYCAEDKAFTEEVMSAIKAAKGVSS